MVSNQILQNTLNGLKDITHMDMCVSDIDGNSLASTFPGADRYDTTIKEFVASQAESQRISGFQFFKVIEDGSLEYVLMVEGSSDDSYMIGKLAILQLQNLIVAYKERFDKDSFFKNLLLDNLLLVDIYSRAKKLHIETNTRRAAFIVESDTGLAAAVHDAMKNAYATQTKDFVTAIDEKDTILVKELNESADTEELEAIARGILDMLKTEGIEDCSVAYGTIVNEIREVSKSYKEAKMAVAVGKIFYENDRVVAYSKLGIGRLIYQLPLPLCRMFIKEIFGGQNPNDFDEETLATINKFFENSLNVSETSRQLYIHRNTLVYRIDKLHKETGLDIRVFDDAITFNIALMVGKYMKFMEQQDY